MKHALLIPFMLVFVAGTAGAQERELTQVEEDSARLGVIIEGLRSTPVETLAINKKKRFDDRLEQAIDLFLADDYVNVGMLLYDVVEDPDYQDEERYNEALYYLAQSLYQMNQLGASRVYFERIVQRRDRRYLDNAVQQLILIADKTRNWEKIDAQVEVLRSRGTLPPTIAYIYMKSLLRQGEPARAKEVLSGVAKEDALWAKARYVAAVCDVQLGRFAEARAGFEELRRIPNVYQDAGEIRDLAAMNVGRLYLEEADLTNAIDAYQDVSRDSELFERALYEVTWTFVRAASRTEDEQKRALEYEKAVRALDILLLAERERPVVPEARLLLGNIRLRMDAFEEATNAFTDVVDIYAPVQYDLAALTEDEATPEEYYDEVVARQRSGGSLLPPLALRWAANENELNEALGVVGDLNESDEWLAESQELVETLLEALASAQRAAFFPGLRDVQVKSVEAKNTLFGLRRRLVAVELDEVKDELTDAEREELEALTAERKRLEPEYQKLPQRIDEYKTQADTMRGEMRELSRQVHQVDLDLTLHQRELVELTRLLSEKTDEMSEEQLADTQDGIDLEAKVVDELLVLSRALKAEIDRKRELIADTTERGSEADALRRRYEETVEREQELLAVALGRSDSSLTSRIQRQSETLDGYSRELEAFNQRLDRVVREKAREIVSDVVVQQRILQSLDQDSSSTRRVAQRVVGQVAVESLAEVQNQFRDIVLRADVGIVDVAWAEKEATTREITDNVSAQRRELERFDAEFREVLSEE